MSDWPPFASALDPEFRPAALWNRAFQERCRKDSGRRRMGVALVRPGGDVSRFETEVLSSSPDNDSLNLRYLERLLKFLLWSRGGVDVWIGGAGDLAAQMSAIFSKSGRRAFDVEFLGDKVYGRPFSIRSCALDALPAAKETSIALGRHTDGCRVGFDLGGSDRKCAAVIDGRCVYSEEVPWDPYFQSDPAYHYAGIDDSIRRAAAHLPRVDAIGGSAAGVYVNNEVRAASLFRGVSKEDFEQRVRGIFGELRSAWGGVPFEVANDGEVTALAGSMSSGRNGVLGVAMGTSVAAGYVTPDGNITSWLNELAFVPVDYREDAPIDEWSGDRGCAVQYLCQQGVGRLATLAGIELPSELKMPERLIEVQRLMSGGDSRAYRVYETIGICFGYAVAQFASFYEINDLLVLGRVMTGEGGDVIVEQSRRVLRAEFPDLAERIKIRTPDEKDKRLGQAVAAASLPALR